MCTNICDEPVLLLAVLKILMQVIIDIILQRTHFEVRKANMKSHYFIFLILFTNLYPCLLFIVAFIYMIL